MAFIPRGVQSMNSQAGRRNSIGRTACADAPGERKHSDLRQRTHRLDDSMPYSRAIEINPATNEIVWKYQDYPSWNFFSPRMGIAQRLANGNTLLTSPPSAASLK
jgi:hypothetical protein